MMSEDRTIATPPGQAYAADITPDSLMADFRGRGIVTILVFTVIVHLVVVVGSSIPYLRAEVLGANTSKMSKDKRVEIALREATIALKEIAEKHELKPQDITSKFASGGSRTSKATTTKSVDEVMNESPKDPEGPISDIENKLREKAVGPDEPDLSGDDDDDELF
jgi:hypothetical protein